VLTTREQLPAYVRSFALPLTDIRALEAKRRELFGADPPQHATALVGLEEGEMRRRLGTALSAQVIERHAEFLAFAHPFFEMGEALSHPTPERLVALDTTSIEGSELLKTTIDLVEVAIAQQVMLTGDAALPELDRIWREGAPEKRQDEDDSAYGARAAPWSKLQKVMQDNIPLRRNLILAAVRRSVLENGGALVYGAGYAIQGDESYLRKVLHNPQFQLRWRPPRQGEAPRPDHGDLGRSTGWHIAVGDTAYPLLTPDELASGALIYTPDLRRLQDLRNKLHAELDGYRVPAALSASAQAVLRQTIWRVAGQLAQ
jgi:hypothetical protein